MLNEDPKNEISVSRGRPKGSTKLKAVKADQPPTVINLTPKNKHYVDSCRQSTHATYSTLINAAVDHARSTDLLSRIEVKEPKAIQRARELLAKWQTPVKKHRAKASNEAAN